MIEEVACAACGRPLTVPRPLKSKEWVICGVPVGEPSPCWETLRERVEETGSVDEAVHMAQFYRRSASRLKSEWWV